MEESIFKINGDSKDSPKEWVDFKHKLLNKFGVEEFVGVVGAPFNWNLNQTVAEKQKQGVRHCIHALVEICGTGEVRDMVRNAQENSVAGVDLREPVDKMRYLITLFTQITASNDILDGENLGKMESLRFSSTGNTNIYSDIVSHLQNFEDLNRDLQDASKLADYAKKKKMGDSLMSVHNVLTVAITAMPLTSALFTYDLFKAQVKQIAQNISLMNPQDQERQSSNSTTRQASDERMMSVTETEYRNIVEQRSHPMRDNYPSNRSNQYEQGGRRSDTQGRYGSDSRERVPTRNWQSESTRGRSPSRGRSQSTDRGYFPRGRSPSSNNSRGFSNRNNRSNSRDRSSSRGHQSRRSSNSTDRKPYDGRKSGSSMWP